jgi:hypothetical protein
VVTTENDSLDDGTPRDHVASQVPKGHEPWIDEQRRAEWERRRRDRNASSTAALIAASLTMLEPINCVHRDERSGRMLLSPPAPGGDWVYIVEIEADSRPVKIGTTRKPAQRMVGLQNTIPFPLRLIALARGGRPLEKAWHRAFDRHHVRAEWFSSYVGEVFTQAMIDAPPHGCARCALMGDRVSFDLPYSDTQQGHGPRPRARKTKSTHHAAERQQASEQ